jgi:hypothetical protein
MKIALIRIVNQLKAIALFVILFLIGHAPQTVYGQQSIPAAGGEARGSGGKASITAGQLIYTTYSSPSGSVSQGVQQAYTVTVVSVDGTSLADRLQCMVYPNPVQHQLSLELEGKFKQGLAYELFDMSGKLMKSSIIESNLTIIPMDDLVASTYLLTVMGKSQAPIKTFKIIKK